MKRISTVLMAFALTAGAGEPTPPAATQPAAPTSSQSMEPRVDTSASPAVNTSPPAATSAAPRTTAPAATSATAPNSRDRLDLETTQITGNRELPRVMYVVPWKRADLGDLAGRPVNSLLDEVLAPVDRDVFRRQNRYYDALRPDTAGKSPAAP